MARYDNEDIGYLTGFDVNSTTVHWLRAEGIHTIGTLCLFTPRRLLAMHGIGEQYLADIEKALAQLGRCLATESTPTPEEVLAEPTVTGEGVTSVKVKFGNTMSSYAYLCDIPGIAVGDHVVVDSPSNGLTVVKVVQIGDTVENVTKATKWIVDKVDVSAHKARLARIERKKLLEAQLEKALEEELRKDRYARLAQADAALAALVAEYNQL